MSFSVPLPNTVPSWMRRLGVFDWSPGSIRADRFELSWLRRSQLVATLEVCKFHEHWSFNFGIWPWQIFIRLPFRVVERPKDMMESWGAMLHAYNGHFHWGAATKIIYWPWDWTHHKTEMWDGEKWVPDIPRYSWPEDDELAEVVRLPYRYVLRSGEVQEVEASAMAMRRELRWRWLPWLPFPRSIDASIKVEFSEEIGEGVGGWKGGCLGCGYTLRRDETIDECLKRMERNRRFE